MKAKLAEGRRNLATLSARQRAADFRKKMERQTGGLSPEIDDRAFAKFDRMKAKVEQAEAEAEALAELRTMDAPSASQPTEEVSEEGLDVSAELETLKRKLRK